MKEHIQDILVGGRPMTKLELALKDTKENADEIIVELQQRIDKAVELLSQDWYSVLRQETINKVKDILQGSD